MKIILHGGLIGNNSEEKQVQMNRSLREITQKAFDFLTTHTAVETVIYAVSLLEDDPLFNAGTGSMLQADGRIRMSAAISDGTNLINSAVSNIEGVRNPVRVAEKLMERVDKALAGAEATAFARQCGFEDYSAEIPERREEFEQAMMAGRHGTVGCVALDIKGNIAAATSTGGTGAELPGRVSDSSTVAGNYANKFCGISCTGIGEDIVNNAVAAKIATRVTDLFPIKRAFEKSFDEIRLCDGDAGAIGLDRDGTICYDHTKSGICFASFDGEVLTSFMDAQ